MPQLSERSFGYRAQLDTGREFAGTLNAVDVSAATALLESLKLKVLGIWPSGAAVRSKPLGPADFKSFNQQLALLVKAGLPIEDGLKLLVADMHRGRLASAIAQISQELDAGATLPQAIEKHRGKFPADYALLVDAGIRSGNLSDVLMNLSEHLYLKQKISDALFRALTYPFFVFLGVLFVLGFLGLVVFPRYQQMISDLKGSKSFVMQNDQYGYWHSQSVPLPLPTRILLEAGYFAPQILTAIGIIMALIFLFWVFCRNRPVMLHLRDWAALHVPFLGPALRNAIIACWCDGLKIAVAGGLDLPAAVELAGSITGSPAAIEDGKKISAAITRGANLDQTPHGKMIPATVTATLQNAIQANNLSDSLGVLSESFGRASQSRAAMIPAILTPVFLIVMGGAIFFVIYAMVLPFLHLMQEISFLY
ncbi:MAG TPA: type II secretion system F family protein [Phycisphaerae bacterium]|nr:type II secretion system F family protein [Phycisphaerae bacterium]